MPRSHTQVARSLRAFRKAHNMGLLRHVRIVCGPQACEAAKSLCGVEYSGDAVPRLPLNLCTSLACGCDYRPVATNKLRRLLNVHDFSFDTDLATRGTPPRRRLFAGQFGE